MFVVIPVQSECGSRFEAHVKCNPGFSINNSVIRCPDCGERLDLPDPLVRPLIRLE